MTMSGKLAILRWFVFFVVAISAAFAVAVVVFGYDTSAVWQESETNCRPPNGDGAPCEVGFFIGRTAGVWFLPLLLSVGVGVWLAVKTTSTIDHKRRTEAIHGQHSPPRDGET